MESILEVHSLIQKQIILVIIALVSSMCLWIFIGVYDFLVIHEVVFDFIINSFCIWLMFAASTPYWNFCTNYGFCCCCHRKTKFVHKRIESVNKRRFEAKQAETKQQVVIAATKRENG